jgi:hypothetical protein
MVTRSLFYNRICYIPNHFGPWTSQTHVNQVFHTSLRKVEFSIRIVFVRFWGELRGEGTFFESLASIGNLKPFLSFLAFFLDYLKLRYVVKKSGVFYLRANDF